MIIDRVAHWRAYSAAPAWARAFGFIASACAETPDGTSSVMGDDIEARISSFTTRPRDAAVLESHRTYADIHVLMSGEEVIEWFPVHDLAVATPYHAGTDAELYAVPPRGAARMVLRPGIFALFFPQDAHLTQIMAGETPARVRKIVMKIKVPLLTLSACAALFFPV